MGRSSKPMTDSSAGTRIEAAAAALSTAIAWVSVTPKTAVGLSSAASSWPAAASAAAASIIGTERTAARGRVSPASASAASSPRRLRCAKVKGSSMVTRPKRRWPSPVSRRAAWAKAASPSVSNQAKSLVPVSSRPWVTKGNWRAARKRTRASSISVRLSTMASARSPSTMWRTTSTALLRRLAVAMNRSRPRTVRPSLRPATNSPRKASIRWPSRTGSTMPMKSVRPDTSIRPTRLGT